MCMYVCMHVCMYACMYMFVYAYILMHIHTWVHAYYMQIYTYLCMHIWIINCRKYATSFTGPCPQLSLKTTLELEFSIMRASLWHQVPHLLNTVLTIFLTYEASHDDPVPIHPSRLCRTTNTVRLKPPFTFPPCK